MIVIRSVLWVCVIVIMVPLYAVLLSACVYIGKVTAMQALFNKQVTKAAPPLKGETNNGQKKEDVI